MEGWEKTVMWRVYYCKNHEIKSAFFDTMEEAAKFAEMVDGYLNKYEWAVAIEPTM